MDGFPEHGTLETADDYGLIIEHDPVFWFSLEALVDDIEDSIRKKSIAFTKNEIKELQGKGHVLAPEKIEETIENGTARTEREIKENRIKKILKHAFEDDESENSSHSPSQ